MYVAVSIVFHLMGRFALCFDDTDTGTISHFPTSNIAEPLLPISNHVLERYLPA